jgi:hypothetical protein
MGNGPRIVEGNRSAPGVSTVEISLDAPEPVEVDPDAAAICGKNQCGAVGYRESGGRDRTRRTSLGGEVGVDFTNPLEYRMRLAAARVQVS